MHWVFQINCAAAAKGICIDRGNISATANIEAPVKTDENDESLM